MLQYVTIFCKVKFAWTLDVRLLNLTYDPKPCFIYLPPDICMTMARIGSNSPVEPTAEATASCGPVPGF